MVRKTTFEWRLLVALAIFSSLFLHVLFLLFTTSDEVKARAITVELIAPERPQEEPVATSAGDTASTPSGTNGEAAPAARAPRGWRAKWKKRWDDFERDRVVHAVNAAALDDTARPGRDDAPLAICGLDKITLVKGAREKNVAYWGALLPTGAFHDEDIDGVTQVTRPRAARIGKMEFALAARRAQSPLDEPKNAVVEFGRDDARCLLGIDLANGVFPITVTHMPIRLSTGHKIERAIVDVKFYDDGTFTLKARAGELSISRGAMYNHEAVGRRLKMFYASAALFGKAFQ